MRDWYAHYADPRPGVPVLHVYAFPPQDGPVAELIAGAQSALAGSGQITLVPEPHLTVAKLGYVDRVRGSGREALATALEEIARDAADVRVVLGPVELSRSSVVLPGTSPQWGWLTSTVRRHASVLIEDVPVPRRADPHIGLAYGAVDAPTSPALARTCAALARTATWQVRQLALVEATQRPDQRRYDTAVLHQWWIGAGYLDETATELLGLGGWKSRPPEWGHAALVATLVAAQGWKAHPMPYSAWMHACGDAQYSLIETAALLAYADSIERGKPAELTALRDRIAPMTTPQIHDWLADTLARHGHLTHDAARYTAESTRGDLIASMWHALEYGARPNQIGPPLADPMIVESINTVRSRLAGR